MNKTMNTVTINGVEYVGKVELVMALISSGMLEAVQPKAEKKSATKGKKASAPKVLRVDKNGLQWIAKYNEAEYRAKSEEMFGKAKPGKDNRETVYRACGWIL